MQDCNKRIEDKFIRTLETGHFPTALRPVEFEAGELSATQIIDVFETQLMSRHLDLRSRAMQKEGNSFYTIGSAGHEGNAAVALALNPTDMAFLHYRSGAFVIQRAKQVDGQTPLYDMLLSFCASSEDPVSGGRHKVLGSKALFIPPQTSTIASHLPKAVGAAFSIPLSAELDVEGVMPEDAIVVCNFGDASANHSTAQGAINSACWASYQSVPLPLLLICEDNGIGISTHTPSGWIESNFRHRPGLHYIACNGLDVLDTYTATREAAAIARHKRQPVFLHIKTVRLLGHAGSDSEFAYHSERRIAEAEEQDPLLYTAKQILDAGLMSPEDIVAMYKQIAARVFAVSQQAATRPRLTSAEAVSKSLIPPKRDLTICSRPSKEELEQLFSHDNHNLGKPQHLAKLINWTLLELMETYPQTLVFGEDVGKKGGVYNVTSKLHDKFGPRRVINTLLDEQAILGAAIGLAHNGFLPIPEIQFLAYVHNAEDQIRGEAATLPFFSNGQYSNPMIIRIAGLAYQKGFGGHFHNDNSFAVFRDIPGVIIACPSNGADAVEMLRTSVLLALEHQRVVIFIEPIALYMKKDLHEVGDGLWSFPYQHAGEAPSIELGQIGVYGDGKDLCIISYGNGYYLSRQAEKILAEKGIACTLVDLRWLAPLNEAQILSVAGQFTNVLVVDECRRTGSISEAILTLLTEGLGENMPSVKRIAAEDCFIPLGSASYAVLPDVEQIVTAGTSFFETSKSASQLHSVKG